MNESDDEYVNDTIDDAIRAACGFPTWRPIETAPLYREILVYFPRYEIKGNPLLRTDKRHFGPASQQVIVMMKRQEFLRPATHWMPLPEPPPLQQEQTGET